MANKDWNSEAERGRNTMRLSQIQFASLNDKLRIVLSSSLRKNESNVFQTMMSKQGHAANVDRKVIGNTIRLSQIQSSSFTGKYGLSWLLMLYERESIVFQP